MDLAWRLMHRWARAVNALDADGIAALYAADARLDVLSGWSDEVVGASAIGQFYVDHVVSDRPFHIVPNSLGFVMVADDHLVFRLRFRGTGMTDNPRVEEGRGLTVLTLDGGKITHQWYAEWYAERYEWYVENR